MARPGAQPLVLESRRAGGDEVRHVKTVSLNGEDITRYARSGGAQYEGLGWVVSHEDIKARPFRASSCARSHS